MISRKASEKKVAENSTPKDKEGRKGELVLPEDPKSPPRIEFESSPV